jgi:glycosyltransferase involved in cell wall biosynthesis
LQIKKILLLWAPLADYSVTCMRELSKRQDVEIYLIYQPANSNAPYNNLDLSFCKTVYLYDKKKEKQLFQFCTSLHPDLIIMSSWNYKFYMYVSKKAKQSGTFVTSTFDGQWVGTMKQRLGIILSSFFLKPCIDNFFVPGDRQAMFAKKLGYKNPFQGYYCANSERFKQVVTHTENKFIFIGRLVQVKGIEYLIAAYKKYRTLVKEPWGLVICGNGHLKNICQNQEGVELNEFVQPSELPQQLSKAKCLVLPSFFEPWGLVIHEAALAGLSIISSSAAGATTFFVRDGQNGYIINPDEHSLLRAMILISQCDDQGQIEMSATSKTLGLLWTTIKWADYVYENILAAASTRNLAG